MDKNLEKYLTDLEDKGNMLVLFGRNLLGSISKTNRSDNDIKNIQKSLHDLFNLIILELRKIDFIVSQLSNKNKTQIYEQYRQELNICIDFLIRDRELLCDKTQAIKLYNNYPENKKNQFFEKFGLSQKNIINIVKDLKILISKNPILAHKFEYFINDNNVNFQIRKSLKK